MVLMTFSFSAFYGETLARPDNRYRVSVSGLTLLFLAWFCAGLLFYLPNNGGSGLALPFNILSWGVMALATLWLAVTLPASAFQVMIQRQGNMRNYALWLLPAGALLWFLPLIWSPSAAVRAESLFHVAALWGLLGFLWLLRCLPSTAVRLRCWLTVLWCAALLQAIFGLLQITVFSHLGGFAGNRPFGIFQQANLQGSFLATGLSCLLFCQLFYGPKRPLNGILSGFAMVFLPAMLVLLQSRTGVLGAALAAVVLSGVFLQRGREIRLLRRQWLLILSGVALALLLQHGMLAPLSRLLFPTDGGASMQKWLSIRDTVYSNDERWYILQTTWQMIQHHPWLGSGYGSFEAAFAGQTLASGGIFNSDTLIHPHNELLYAWSEGGLPALFGLLMMVAGVLLSLWQPGGLRWSGLALLLPLAVHMNLEYPLYQSVPHGMALVILLSLVLSPRVSAPAYEDSAVRTGLHQGSGALICLSGAVLRGMVLITGLAVLLFMAGGLQTQQTLTAIERQGMTPLALDEVGTVAHLWNPYSLPARLDYDRHVALLMRYNRTRDVHLLTQFDSWAAEYLTRHNDPNVVASRKMIARALATH